MFSATLTLKATNGHQRRQLLKYFQGELPNINRRIGNSCKVTLVDSRNLRNTKPQLFDCDKFLIRAPSRRVAKAAADTIKRKIHQFHDAPTPKQYIANISCPPRLVGAVIGKAGSNIKQIRSFAGFGTYIQWEKDIQQFVIRANSSRSFELAKMRLTDCIKQISNRKPSRDYSQPRTKINLSGVVQNRSGAFHSLQEPEEEQANQVDTKEELKIEFTIKRRAGLIDINTIQEDKDIRHKTRREMANWRNDDGTFVYPERQFKNFKTGQVFKMKHSNRVPWGDVDKEILSRRNKEEELEGRKTYTPIREDLSDIEQWKATSTAKLSQKKHACWSSISSGVMDGSNVPTLKEQKRKIKTSKIKDSWDSRPISFDDEYDEYDFEDIDFDFDSEEEDAAIY